MNHFDAAAAAVATVNDVGNDDDATDADSVAVEVPEPVFLVLAANEGSPNRWKFHDTTPSVSPRRYREDTCCRDRVWLLVRPFVDCMAPNSSYRNPMRDERSDRESVRADVPVNHVSRPSSISLKARAPSL